MACVTACPSGVKYDRLVEATRAQLQRQYRRSPGEIELMDAAIQGTPASEVRTRG